jgi:DNA-binding HxlR family transcriptional regulator
VHADGEGAYCATFHAAVELIGRRWSGAIIQALLSGATRFGEVRDLIPDLSDKMLSDRLKELETEGIVERIVIPETPVRTEYRLTPKGRDLLEVMREIGAWAHRWEADASRSAASSTGGRRSAREAG